MNRQPTVLVVDDEKHLCRSLQILLEEEGPFVVRTATDYYSALEWLREPIDLVLTDLTMPGKGGIELLRTVREKSQEVPVILMTAYSTVESAVTAMKEGATDYIVKPFENDKLVEVLRKAFRKVGIETRPNLMSTEVTGFGDLIGQSEVMREVYGRIQRAADAEATVLLTGESGTGKELAAKAIHFSGPRKSRPFIAVNCAAIPESLLESELFGHEKGSFTGAIRQKEGKFELADGGTLFLDEIGEMNASLQVKLLRVLQEKAFVRVGGEKEICVDVRIITATNRKLEKEVQAGRFREDLFFRLNVVQIHLPPLREHVEDLPGLIDHFLTEKTRKNSTRKTLTEGALRALLNYGYPGNVRELENLIERAVVMTPGERIEESGLPFTGSEGLQPLSDARVPVEQGFEVLRKMNDHLEKNLIERAVKTYPDKSNSELAAILGTTRRILEMRLRQFNVKK